MFFLSVDRFRAEFSGLVFASSDFEFSDFFSVLNLFPFSNAAFIHIPKFLGLGYSL